MKIIMRGLNEGETYCCTKKSLKLIFKDTPINVSFGYSISRTEAKNNSVYSPNKNCRDSIIAVMDIYYNSSILSGKTYLKFFILNKANFNDELRERFEKEVLPQLYNLYCKYNVTNKYEKYCKITIGLFDKQFNIYENIA